MACAQIGHLARSVPPPGQMDRIVAGQARRAGIPGKPPEIGMSSAYTMFRCAGPVGEGRCW